MKSNLVDFFLKLYDRMTANRVVVMVVAGVVIATSSSFLMRVELDMSFNPFFSNDPIDNETTERLQKEFGTRLGAYIGVVIEREDAITASFLPALDALSADVERIDHVTEVISLARFPIPAWHAGGAGTTELFGSAMDPDVDSLWSERSTSDVVRGVILSRDGCKTLLLARLGLPMNDAPGRAVVIGEFKDTVRAHLQDEVTLRFVGYSVVEEIFSGIVLRSLAQTFALTFLTLMVLLWIVYRRAALVSAALIGVSVATPVSIGVMVLIGQKVTMINSIVPVVIMIIGAADAIHMIQSFLALRQRTDKPDAIRRMFGETGLPCMLTTVTTACGFLGLTIARIDAIRDFGMNVAIGVVIVWIFNLVFIPALLSWVRDSRLEASEAVAGSAQRWAVANAGFVVKLRTAIVAGFVVLVAVAAGSVHKLDLNQYVNGEVSPDTPMRADQLVLEREFGGFLGPEIAVARRDLEPFEWARDVATLRSLEKAVSDIPDVDRVESVLDFIPDGLPPQLIGAGITGLRKSERLGIRMRTLIDQRQTRVSFTVHVSDNGTKRSEAVIDRIRDVAEVTLGTEYVATPYGGWYLGQTGMQNVSRDMLMSFATSMLLVLPILAFALGSVRLFVVSLIPNLMPMVFALAFSVWVGIPIRIGTAMVLAIAFGIAVDDTIHMMIRLKAEHRAGHGPVASVMVATAHTGVAILYSSIVLIAGFLTMLVNDVFAIQDMGVLAAATLLIAFLSDVYLAPALFLMSAGSRRRPVTAATKAAGFMLLVVRCGQLWLVRESNPRTTMAGGGARLMDGGPTSAAWCRPTRSPRLERTGRGRSSPFRRTRPTTRRR